MAIGRMSVSSPMHTDMFLRKEPPVHGVDVVGVEVLLFSYLQSGVDVREACRRKHGCNLYEDIESVLRWNR